MSAAVSSRPHGLVLSFPMQGHINPLLRFSSMLAGSHGFAMTFVLSELEYTRTRRQHGIAEHKKNSTDLDDGGREEEGKRLEMLGHDHGPAGFVKLVGVSGKLPKSSSSASKRTGGAEFWDSYDALGNMREGVEELLTRLQASPCPVSFILADTFVDWAHQVAGLFNLPLFAFFTSNAASALIFLHAPSLLCKGILPFRDENDEFIANDPVTDIPGLLSVYPRDFPICFTFGPSHYRYQFVLRHHKNFHHCVAMVMNSFEELEPTAVAALRKDVNVLPIGPLPVSFAQNEHAEKLSMNYWPEDSECLNWLDSQGASSVLYVSFGSIATMSAYQMQQLASGLEASQQPFLWVIRTDSIEGNIMDILPDGFVSRIKEQGVIISWAPQVAVLSHVAVGGFLTHCGWNSTLENLSVGGLPVICWPLVAEQRMNCRIFVDDWRIGVEVVRNEDGMVEKDKVEKAVRVLMQGDEGKEMKARVKKLQEFAAKAVFEGSSTRNLATFVQACAASACATHAPPEGR